MAPDRAQNLQDVFLKHLQEHNVPVTIFLMNGIKLQGYITHSDKFGILLMRDQHSQFVYKRVISSIHPMTVIQMTGGDDENS